MYDSFGNLECNGAKKQSVEGFVPVTGLFLAKSTFKLNVCIVSVNLCLSFRSREELKKGAKACLNVLSLHP